VPEAAVATEQGQYFQNVENGKRKTKNARGGVSCDWAHHLIFDRLTSFKERVKLTYCLTFVIGIVTHAAAELELEMTLGMCLWLKLKMAAITSPRATSTPVVKFSLQRSSILYKRHWWCLSAA